MTSTTAITTSTSTPAFLMSADNKDAASRLALFVQWLTASGQDWRAPDLRAYANYLMTDYRGRNSKPLSPASAAAHLSTIRGRYAALLKDNTTREVLYAQTPPEASPADKAAMVNEVLVRLQNAIDPNISSVKVPTAQDVTDTRHTRLTIPQVNTLLEAPFNDPQNTPLQAVRDTALIALMLCTGIREMEVCKLKVADLRQHYGGALALHVTSGKGLKARLVPYGELDWCLAYVDKWLALAGITEGEVFRGFYKGGKRVRAGSLTVRAVQDILNRYPVSLDGRAVCVNPHDLRRTYARRLYDSGMPLIAIQQNLGHADSKTTEGYIGRLDAGQRQPVRLFRPPHLKRLEGLTLV
jgi:integrase